MRPDDVDKMLSLQGSRKGQKALIILGGTSAKNWEYYWKTGKYNFIIGANGVSKVLPNIDYWLMSENLKSIQKRAKNGSKRDKEILQNLPKPKNAIALMNFKSAELYSGDIIKIKRHSFVNIFDFAPREYGEGLLTGSIFGYYKLPTLLRVGTVALQAIHLACILGCSEFTTIGFDLCFKEKEEHWYEYPSVRGGIYWDERMYVNYEGLNTMWIWIETAQYAMMVDRILQANKIKWNDVSDGLLQRFGK